jgi:hypothetical protein
METLHGVQTQKTFIKRQFLALQLRQGPRF